jgi:hypothetical protein
MMTGKILAAAVAAAVLLSAGVASAQTNVHVKRVADRQAQFVSSYFDKAYWDAISPHGRFVVERDPFAGTVWENVVPY